jgi:hypothetical protein
LDIPSLAGLFTYSYKRKTIKTPLGECVKASQMIVKSCKNGGCSTAILTLLSPAGTPGGVAPITQLATNAKCNLLNVDFYGAARVVLRFAEHNHVTVLPLPNGR